MSKRKQFTPEQKVAMVRRHLIENVPVSDLCDEFGIHATQYYGWQKQLFENAEGAFVRRPNKANVKRQHNAQEKKISQLEEKLQGRNEVVAELMQEHVQLKKRTWGTLNGIWVPHDVRDRVVDYVRYWKDRTEIAAHRILDWMGVPEGTFYNWKQRYGKVNEHNGWIPRDHWLEDREKRAILDFYWEHPLDGYRRLTYMMLDANVVAVSASSVYRVLKGAGVLDRHNMKPSRKGKGFHQPSRPHRHWHIDIAYLNLGGTFYYMCSILDGYSRFIVHWALFPDCWREKMTDQDVETILQRAREKFPGETPRIISDNGPRPTLRVGARSPRISRRSFASAA